MSSDRLTVTIVSKAHTEDTVVYTYRPMVNQPQDEKSQAGIRQGWLKWAVVSMNFGENSSDEFRQVVLCRLQGALWYKNGATTEQLFPGWARAGYEVMMGVQQDVSFRRFWDSYGKKVGNKALCEKKWGQLSESDRVMALRRLSQLKHYYEKNGLQLPYPQTFIDQRRWENEVG